MKVSEIMRLSVLMNGKLELAQKNKPVEIKDIINRQEVEVDIMATHGDGSLFIVLKENQEGGESNETT